MIRSARLTQNRNRELWYGSSFTCLSGVKDEISMGSFLFLDSEFLDRIPKNLNLSLQENTEDFSTLSYMKWFIDKKMMGGGIIKLTFMKGEG